MRPAPAPSSLCTSRCGFCSPEMDHSRGIRGCGTKPERSKVAVLCSSVVFAANSSRMHYCHGCAFWSGRTRFLPRARTYVPGQFSRTNAAPCTVPPVAGHCCLCLPYERHFGDPHLVRRRVRLARLFATANVSRSTFSQCNRHRRDLGCLALPALGSRLRFPSGSRC